MHEGLLRVYSVSQLRNSVSAMQDLHATKLSCIKSGFMYREEGHTSIQPSKADYMTHSHPHIQAMQLYGTSSLRDVILPHPI